MRSYPHVGPCLLLCLVLGLSACGSTIIPFAAAQPDVYLAGFVIPAANEVAMYWKNGAGVALTDGTHRAIATGIAVAGIDVYVVGNVGGATHQIAVLWKNGVATPLTDGTKDGYASGIVVSGSHVFVSGSELGLDSSGNLYAAAEYWDNGVPTLLANPAIGAMARSIFVSGNDVYVAGSVNKTTQVGPSSIVSTQVATYWKNGVQYELTTAATPSDAYSIFAADQNVYVSGFNCTMAAAGCERAAYWINGVLTQLNTTNPSTGVGIAWANGNTYVADNEVIPSNSYKAVLWINGHEQVLSQAPIAAANDVRVLGNDVYVPGASPLAGYFKNGNFLSVASGGSATSSAYAIALVSH